MSKGINQFCEKSEALWPVKGALSFGTMTGGGGGGCSTQTPVVILIALYEL
jgi:hypothetical protein